MERTTIEYIIRSLVILETKWNALVNKIAWWVNVPGPPLGIVHRDVRIVEGPGRLQQQQRGRCGSSASISRYICSTGSSRRSTRRSSGGSSNSSSSGINRCSRRGAAVAATSAGVVALSGRRSYGISRRCCCYIRIYSIWARGNTGCCGRGCRGRRGCGGRCGNSKFRRT